MDGFFDKVLRTITGDRQDNKDFWVDDTICKCCYECEQLFSVFVRRHHCRICGRVFCAPCTQNFIQPPRDSADQSWLRVCNYCYRVRQRDDPFKHEAGHVAERRSLKPARDFLQESAAVGVKSTASGTSERIQTPKAVQPKDHIQVAGTYASAFPQPVTAEGGEVPAPLDESASTTTSAASPSIKHGPVEQALLWDVPAHVLGQEIPQAELGHGEQVEAEMLISDVETCRKQFHEVAFKHLHDIISQLLQAEDVKDVTFWHGVIFDLATAGALSLSPSAASAFGKVDPRYFIKVKKVVEADGAGDSEHIQGVVLKKNVAHRRMRTSVDNARVVLLGGALEYQRVANKLSSFDTLLDQEREHLSKAVARISTLRPDVLLVEKTVARSAQEELLQRNISLVLNVKKEQLERLSRCMGCKVVPSVEELDATAVGYCKKFCVEALQNKSLERIARDLQPSGEPVVRTLSSRSLTSSQSGVEPSTGSSVSRTLMYFIECPRQLGSTILLKDASPQELVKLKRVTKMAILAAYHQSLESGFLAEMLVSAAHSIGFEGMHEEGTDMYAKLAREWPYISAAKAAEARRYGTILSISPHVILSHPSPAKVRMKGEDNGIHATHGSEEGVDAEQRSEDLGGAHTAMALADSGRSSDELHATSAASSPLRPLENNGISHSPRSCAGQRAANQMDGRGDMLADTLVAADPDLTPDASLTPNNISITPELVLSVSQASEKDVGAMAQNANASWPGTDDTVDTATNHSYKEGEREPDAVETLMPTFTDPLRRPTLRESDVLEALPLSHDIFAADDESMRSVEFDHSDHVNSELSLRLEGLQLYDKQRLFFSMACRNPRRQLLCEASGIKSIEFYSQSDLSLAGFIAAASPHPQKQCHLPLCGEGVTSHVRTFLHGNLRITLSVASVPPEDALPGEDEGQIWMWLRPKAPLSARHVSRIKLAEKSCCLSFGLFLHVSFTAMGLQLCHQPVHTAFVRYFGHGRTVMCLHEDSIVPFGVSLPRLEMRYSFNAQLKWLKQEAAELIQESNEGFDVVELSLQQHPFFQREDPPSSASAYPHASLASMMLAVRRDRSSFIAKISECIRSITGTQGADRVYWDEALMAAMLVIGRLRRSLSITLLTWAATLQNPAFFALATAQAAASGSRGGHKDGSHHSMSETAMFHVSPVVAAQRMGLTTVDAGDRAPSDGRADAVGALSAAPAPVGPIAVQAVVDLVAVSAMEGDGKGASGLLEGSQLVMQAVAQQHNYPMEGTTTSAQRGPPFTADERMPGGPHEAAAASDAEAAGAESGNEARLTEDSTHEVGFLGGSDGVDGASTAPPVDRSSDSLDSDEEASRRGFLQWLTSHEIALPAEDDSSDLYPGELPPAEPSTASPRWTPNDSASTGSGAPSLPSAANDGAQAATAPLRSDRARSRLPDSPSSTREGRGQGMAAEAGLEAAAAAAAADASLRAAPPQPVPCTAGSTVLPMARHERAQGCGGDVAGRAAGRDGVAHSPAGTAASRQAADASPAVSGPRTPRAAGASPPAGAPGGASPPTAVHHHERRGSLPSLDDELAKEAHASSQAFARSTEQYFNPAGLASLATRPQATRHKLEAGGVGPAGAVPVRSSILVQGRTLLPPGINDTVVPIFDAEPTSVVSYFLSSRAYQQRLNAAMRTIVQDVKKQQHKGSAPGAEDMSGEQLLESDWLAILLSRDASHVKHSFDDDSPGIPWAKAKFQVVAYYAPQFAELRRRSIRGGEGAFTDSLTRCRKWRSRGGKSNAYFAKTRDDRFIIKSMSKPEKASFLDFAPAYFGHIARALRTGRTTCLAKVVGAFSVHIKGVPGPGNMAAPAIFKEGPIDLLVMENVFYDRQISRIYDLKGSERARFNADAAANPHDSGEVHLDDNLRRNNMQAPILVRPATLRRMERALWSDTAFLAGLGVMDYSLLVGLDREENELVVAVIDYIRQYTWDKQLETWVKSSGILGGNGKEPTIISPKQYMRRFRVAISSYFTAVPSDTDVEPPLDPDEVGAPDKP